MILFFLLLLDPPSLLHPRGPGCAVPGDHAPSASCATAILDRGPLFVSLDAAEEAECGESAAVLGALRLGRVPARRKGEDPRRGGELAWWPGRRAGSPAPGADQGRAAPGAGVPEDAGRAGLGWLAGGVPRGRGGCARVQQELQRPRGQGGEPPAGVQFVRRISCFCNAQSLDWV